MRTILILLLIPFLSFSQVKLKGYELTDSTQTNIQLKDINATKVLKGFVFGDGSLEQPPDEGGTCSDGIQNGDETGVDCGGSCPPCVEIPSCTNGGAGSIVPTTAADFTNAAYNNYTFTINNNIDLTGVSITATTIKIVPGTGILSGTGITLNDACIEDAYTQVFSSSVTFTSPYSNSQLSPEAFGADGTDIVSDDAAISALINNVEYAIGNTPSVYVKNLESTYTRAGLFNWDMNGSIVRTTSAQNLSHGGETSNQERYLFIFNGVDDIRIYNGEFDGQDLASRLFLVERHERHLFQGLYVHNYFAPAGAYARGVAFLFKLFPQSSNFLGGDFLENNIESIGAASDGNANNAPFGVAKGVWIEHQETAITPIQMRFSDNTYNNIYGDDAEGFYNAPGYLDSYNYTTDQITTSLTRETFIGCQRRAMKIVASNTSVTNSSITSVSTAPSFAGQQANIVEMFSIRSSGNIRNVTFTGNTVNIIGNAQNFVFGMRDIEDSNISNNS